MSDQTPSIGTVRIKTFFSLFKQALSGKEQDYTQGSIRRAVFLLAVPMILEMCLESVFAVVDIFFVGKLGSNATATVGLTESVLTIIYSIAIGLSMAATAVVARRIGEKNPEGAARAGAQAIMVALTISLFISIAGVIYAEELLALMGATDEIMETGASYTRVMLAGNAIIMMLFLLNGIFRGAGDASIAMKSLWLAN